MKILITGSNGFIGKNIIKELNKKHEIIATSLSQKYSGTEDIKYISANLSYESFVDKIKEKVSSCDIIIHNGACIDYDFFSSNVIMTNCLGVQRVIKLGSILKCKKIIFISSLPIIGKPINIPITESHIVNPQTVYHATKLFGEQLLLMNNNLDIKPIIFRITSPIGINMPKNRMLSVFIDNILNNKDIVIFGKGKRKQNYVDVRDIANAIELACEKKVSGLFNIAGDRSYTSIELANECQRVINKSVNIKFNDIILADEYYNWEVSTQKATTEIGYKCRYSLEDSIKSIIDL